MSKINLLQDQADNQDYCERDATVNTILVLMMAAAGFTAYFTVCLLQLPVK